VSNSNFDNLERAIVLRGGAGLWEHRNAPDETVLSTTSSFICTYVASFLVLPFIGVPVTHGQNLLPPARSWKASKKSSPSRGSDCQKNYGARSPACKSASNLDPTPIVRQIVEAEPELFISGVFDRRPTVTPSFFSKIV
jgi:hypothetical protein